MGLALADVAERDRATGPAQTAPQAVARVYENYLQVIVRDSAPVQRLADLEGLRVSIGPGGSGGAMTSEVLFEAAGLPARMDFLRYRLSDGLAGLADGSLDALVWSGGVPTPAITKLAATTPLRMLDIGELAAPMSQLAGYPVRCATSADRRLRATGNSFSRSARSAAVPPANVRRPGRCGRERTCHRRTATGAALRPGSAVPRRALDDPDRSHPPASGCCRRVPKAARLNGNPSVGERNSTGRQLQVPRNGRKCHASHGDRTRAGVVDALLGSGRAIRRR